MKPKLVSALNRAKQMPPPIPGRTFSAVSLDVACEYVNLHGLETVRVTGSQIVLRVPKDKTMLETAKDLAKAGS